MPGQLEQQINFLAKLIVGEAGTEGGDNLPQKEEAMRAIANTILNRSFISGKGILQEAMKPNQYTALSIPSYWKQLGKDIQNIPKTYSMAQSIAKDLLSGTLKDNTGGATFYYNPNEVVTPAWAKGKTPNTTIGNHLFFNNIEPYPSSKLNRPEALANIVTPEQKTSTEEQHKPLIVFGKATPEEMNYKGFAQRATEHSQGGKASDRFQKAFDAWVGSMTDEQKNIAKEYLPEYFPQKTPAVYAEPGKKINYSRNRNP